jgi:hypothetical protein
VRDVRYSESIDVNIMNLYESVNFVITTFMVPVIKTPWTVVRKRTIPTERPPIVG